MGTGFFTAPVGTCFPEVHVSAGAAACHLRHLSPPFDLVESVSWIWRPPAPGCAATYPGLPTQSWKAEHKIETILNNCGALQDARCLG